MPDTEGILSFDTTYAKENIEKLLYYQHNSGLAVSGWSDITGAAYGADYTLSYWTDGNLAGYTVLTVGVVPEPVSGNGHRRQARQ